MPFNSGVCLHKRRSTSPSSSLLLLLCFLRYNLFESHRFKFQRLRLLSSTTVLMKQVEEKGGGHRSPRSRRLKRIRERRRRRRLHWKDVKVVTHPPCFHAPLSPAAAAGWRRRRGRLGCDAARHPDAFRDACVARSLSLSLSPCRGQADGSKHHLQHPHRQSR